tara:strand:- start:772 stop:3147 length:2376 start_codon:yes stop_codon:yes gene_type:complete
MNIRGLIIIMLVLSSCRNFNVSETQLVDLVPTKPVFILKIQSTNVPNFEKFFNGFNTIINYKFDSKIDNFLDKPLIISYHDMGNDKFQPIIITDELNIEKNLEVIDSTTYNGFTIKQIKFNESYLFSAVKNGIYLESKSKLLIENSLRNSTHLKTENSSDMLRLYQISNSKISLLYNGKFSKILKDNDLAALFFQNETSDWMQNDIDIKNNKLTVNGVAVIKDSLFSKINTLRGIKTSKFNFKSVVPLNFKKIERFSHNHFEYISNLKNFVSVDEFKKISNDSLFYDINEIGNIFLENDTISISVFKNINKLKSKILETTKSMSKYRGYDIFELSDGLFLTENINRGFPLQKQKFATLLENKLILSNYPNPLEYIILNYTNKSTLGFSQDFEKKFQNLPETSNVLRIYNTNNFAKDLLQKLNIDSEKYNFWYDHTFVDENVVYNTRFTEKLSEQFVEKGPKVVFNLKFNDEISLAPKWVKNYVTKKPEILTQDRSNNLYLVGEDGNIVWRKKIEDQIIGKVHQVDLYRNGRLQYAFVTNESFMIIDKNGNLVKKVKHKNNKKVIGLSVFDYDKNRNYRFLICFENDIKMLDSNMKTVRGFSTKNIQSPISALPKHFRIGSKDFLVVKTEKKLLILDRRGNIRLNIDEKIKSPTSETFINKNSFIYVMNNDLVTIDLKGNAKITPLPLDSEYGFVANQNNLIYVSENVMTINNVNFELKFGNYTNPQLFFDEIVSVTDLDLKKIYLFNSDGSPIENFPIYGTGVVDINTKKNKSKLLVTLGEKNEILVYSIN